MTLWMTSALTAALLTAPPPVHQDQGQEHPILAQVKAAVKDPAKPFTLLVIVKIKPDGGDTFEAAFAKAHKETRKEKGNLAYDLNRSTKAGSEYLLYERWQNLAALQAHLQAPHFAALLEEIGTLLEGPPELRIYVPAERK